MHALVFAAFFTPHRNGISTYIRTYAKALRKHGVKISVVTYDLGGLSRREKIDGIEVYRLPSRTILGGTQIAAKKNETYRRMMRQLEKLPVDVVLTNTRFFPSTILGLNYARKCKIPVVHIEHGNRHVLHSNPLVRAFAFLYDHTIGKRVMRGASGVVAISSPGVRFCKHLGARAPVYIPNAIDTKIYIAKPSRLRKTLRIPPKIRVIAYVGRLIKGKGVHDLLRALQVLPDVHLVLVGDGPYRNTLERIAARIGYPVSFLGSQDQAQVIQALNGADVFVNPSYSEGLPTSVLEAAAVGVPIVATDVGGTRDILGEHHSGLVMKVGNPDALSKHIAHVLENLKDAQKEATLVRSRIKKIFSITIVAKQFYKYLKDISGTK